MWTAMQGRKPWLLAAGAVAAFGLLLFDELFRSDEPFTFQALFFELLDLSLLVACTVCSALLLLRVRAQEEETGLLRRDLELLRVDGQQWREAMAVHLRALGSGIRRQFDAWGLSASEQEVGLLLIKGFSHKEIARLRGTSEITIRQQAAAIYRKSNLSGRAALSAFFLEDVLNQA